MKIPKTFVPEKGLENKVGQLIENPKTYKKEYNTKQYSEEIEKILSEFNPIYTDYEYIHSGATNLAEKTGYKLINKKSDYEYWTKPTGLGESYILVSFGKKFEKHYMFARVKDENFKKFYRKLGYKRKMVYPKSLMLAGLVSSAYLAMAYVYPSYPGDTFLKDILSWVLSTISIVPILFLPKIVKEMQSRVSKKLEKYCIGLITGDDKKALEAAFS